MVTEPLRLGRVASFSNDFDAFALTEHESKLVTGEGFVVDDDRANAHCGLSFGFSLHGELHGHQGTALQRGKLEIGLSVVLLVEPLPERLEGEAGALGRWSPMGAVSFVFDLDAQPFAHCPMPEW